MTAVTAATPVSPPRRRSRRAWTNSRLWNPLISVGRHPGSDSAMLTTTASVTAAPSGQSAPVGIRHVTGIDEPASSGMPRRLASSTMLAASTWLHARCLSTKIGTVRPAATIAATLASNIRRRG